MGKIVMRAKGLVLLDKKGKELAHTQVRQQDVTAVHIWKLKDIGNVMGLSVIEVQKGLFSGR